MHKLVALLALALGVNNARADSGSFYLGAGISKDKVSGIVNGATSFTDIDSTSWKLLAGFRPLSVFAVEADYLDLGSHTTSIPPGVGTCPVGGCPVFHSDAKAFAGYAVGFLPIPLPFLDVFGKAGLARWKLNASAVQPPSSFSNNGTGFAWGVGTQIHVGNLGARLEYESFHIPNTNGASAVSLGMYLNIF